MCVLLDWRQILCYVKKDFLLDCAATPKQIMHDIKKYKNEIYSDIGKINTTDSRWFPFATMEKLAFVWTEIPTKVLKQPSYINYTPI